MLSTIPLASAEPQRMPRAWVVGEPSVASASQSVTRSRTPVTSSPMKKNRVVHSTAASGWSISTPPIRR
jgi:hypothetical protein